MPCEPESFDPEFYQELGIEHLLENLHAALFAGCGLGKTAMTLAAFAELKRQGKTRGMLVVAPLRVANLTWKKEVQKWKEFCHLKVANLRTEEGMDQFLLGEADIYTINYEALPKFCSLQMFDVRKIMPFDIICWDELSKCKSHKSIRVKAMQYYWHRIKRHWGLTGTPSSNSKLDLFGEIKTLDNGHRLGDNFFKFRKKYFYSVDQEERKWAIRKRNVLLLEEKIHDMVLVLKSEDWLDIPDVTIEDVDVVLPKCAQKTYKELEKKLFLLFDEQTVEALNAAVLIGKLLQITSGAIYDSDKNIIDLHDAKLKALKQVYKSCEGPLMVAFQYQHEEERILETFPDAEAFSDARTVKAQDSIADRWNSGDIPMLVCHPASVGHGLNLQDGGHTICHTSLGHSRELYDQINARLARKGQKNPPRVVRLLCKGTVDIAIAESLKRKGDDQAAVMDAIMNMRLLGKL